MRELEQNLSFHKAILNHFHVPMVCIGTVFTQIQGSVAAALLKGRFLGQQMCPRWLSDTPSVRLLAGQLSSTPCGAVLELQFFRITSGV